MSRRDDREMYSPRGRYQQRDDRRRNGDSYGRNRDRDGYSGYGNDRRESYGGRNSTGGRDSRRESDITDDAEPGTGVIEKLKDSYGFIACIGRKEHLFFHYSQLSINPEDVQINDEVEFKISVDRKSRREVALQVVVLPQGTLDLHSVEATDVVGTVVKRARPQQYRSGGPFEGDSGNGRIVYEVDGKELRITYTLQDYLPASSSDEPPRENDEVKFSAVFDKISGKRRAINVEMVKRFEIPTTDGIVCSIKDGFGFIDRADIAAEIFFHFTEYQERDIPQIGDEVRFEVTERNGKPIAVRVQMLPRGTVNFETVLEGQLEGTILRIPRKPRRGDRGPNIGTISYEEPVATKSADGPNRESSDAQGEGSSNHEDQSQIPSPDAATIPFAENEVLLESAAAPLGVGDRVTFRRVMDNRSNKMKAYDVQLLKRYVRPKPDLPIEQGIVGTLKDGYGFIKCADRDARIFFHYSELDGVDGRDLRTGDSVEFYVVAVADGPQKQSVSKNEKQQAVGIKLLPFDTVKFEILHSGTYRGIISKAVPRGQNSGYNRRSSGFGGSSGQQDRKEEPGLISCEKGPDGTAIEVKYADRDTSDIRTHLKLGDIVSFQLETNRRTKHATARNIDLVFRPENVQPKVEPIATASAPDIVDPSDLQYGFVTTLKEGFGFIESPEADKETFFHSSEVKGNGFSNLNHAVAVSYVEAQRQGRAVATRVTPLSPEERVALLLIDDEVFDGIVVNATFGDSNTYVPGTIEFVRSGAADEQDVDMLNIQEGTTLSVDESTVSTKELSESDIHAKIDEAEAPATNMKEVIQFGFAGLTDRDEALRANDEVKFQIATFPKTGNKKAVNIRPVNGSRKRDKSERFVAKVDTVKGTFGFLAFQAPDTDVPTLFFHVNAVYNKEMLNVGDEVSFNIGMNTRKMQPQAINIKIVSRAPRFQQEFIATQRPDRMVMKLESCGTEGAPRFGMTRAPTGPDGTRGFSAGRGRSAEIAREPVLQPPGSNESQQDESIAVEVITSDVTEDAQE